MSIAIILLSRGKAKEGYCRCHPFLLRSKGETREDERIVIVCFFIFFVPFPQKSGGCFAGLRREGCGHDNDMGMVVFFSFGHRPWLP